MLEKEKVYANLHMHSTHSDGPYSPKELVKIAKKEGYRAIAISDHDTGSAFSELKEACEKEGMEYIFAVEFSVTEPAYFHIVGFDFDPEYPPMKDYLEKMAVRQTDNTKKCFEEAVENGNITGITWEEVLEFNKGIPWLCNNHVFRAMKSKGFVEESEYMHWFEKNFRVQRGKYKPLYPFKPLADMVKLIKDAGGFAVCAHPEKAQLDNIGLLLKSGIEGLEILHPRLTEEDRQRAFKICMDNNLYISGGSDHCGLCGGYYDSYPTKEELEKSYHFIEPLTMGVCEKYFREIKTRVKKSNRQ